VSKTIPAFKNKEENKDIQNYRHVATLCSVSKVFKKFSLKRILDIQKSAGVDQNGFKKGRSISTSMQLVS
jgi:hypothetical protein